MSKKTGKNTGKNTGPNGKKANDWEPGQSPNPAGRPKGAKDGIEARIRRLLRRHPTTDELARLEKEGYDVRDPAIAALLAQRLVSIGLDGKDIDAHAAIKTLLDRDDGPVKQRLEVTGNVGLHNMTDEELLERASDATQRESQAE